MAELRERKARSSTRSWSRRPSRRSTSRAGSADPSQPPTPMASAPVRQRRRRPVRGAPARPSCPRASPTTRRRWRTATARRRASHEPPHRRAAGRRPAAGRRRPGRHRLRGRHGAAGCRNVWIPLRSPVFIAVGEVLRIVPPGGRQAAPLASAGSAGVRAAAGLPGSRRLQRHRGPGCLASPSPRSAPWSRDPAHPGRRGLHLDELARRVFTTRWSPRRCSSRCWRTTSSTRPTAPSSRFAMTVAALVAACVDARCSPRWSARARTASRSAPP